jgi:hypothetical protein
MNTPAPPIDPPTGEAGLLRLRFKTGEYVLDDPTIRPPDDVEEG